MWLLGLATLYLGGQVSCKPQEPGNQFQSRNLGTATPRKFHASSDPPSSGQRHYNTSSDSTIYCFGAPPSARPTLGGFWMCCICLCARPQLLVFIPARKESAVDAGRGAHGCDDEVRRSFGQETRIDEAVPPPVVVLTRVSRTSTSCRDAWTWGSGAVEGTVDAQAGYG
ncbi:hypothetical protein K438DRAFT_947629 [Mycena galopus ATCC 62051]|nr:hypothetical protein K438DRAFT_947629 [Mycena galopus ATCC 62051]